MRGYWSDHKEGRPQHDRKKAIEEDFVPYVRGVLDKRRDLRSAMLAVAQYWADEADDAVHATVLFSARETPLWPHPCTWFNDEERAPDPTEFCGSCGNEGGWMPFDDNGHSIPTFQPCCREDASQESDTTEAYLPYAVARRVGDTNEIEVELVGGPVRAWLDHVKYVPSEGYEDDDDADDDDDEDEDDDDDVDGVVAPVIPEPTPKRDAQTQELFDMVFADPTDDGARQVLADHLQQKDDPMGQYITVAMAVARAGAGAGAKPELRAQMADLESRFGAKWLGPLRVVAPPDYVKFSRGLLRSLAVYFDKSEHAAKLADAIEWGSVEDLRFLPQSKHRLSPAMKSLRSVSVLDATAPLADLGEGLKRLTHLHFRLGSEAMVKDVASLDVPALRALTLGAASASFGGGSPRVGRNPFTGQEMVFDNERPDLANISPESILPILKAKVWKQLDTLTLVSCAPACVSAWLDHAPGNRPKTLAFTSAVPSGPPAGFRLRIEQPSRDDVRAFIDMPSIGGQMTTVNLSELLTVLPAHAKISVETTKWFTPKDKDLEELRDRSKRDVRAAAATSQ